MPMLIGYLVALALLLGGGYLGLEWLASPDQVTTHQHAGATRTAGNLPKKNESKPESKSESKPESQSERSDSDATSPTAVAGEADGASKAGIPAPAALPAEVQAAEPAKPADAGPAAMTPPTTRPELSNNDRADAGRNDAGRNDHVATGGTSQPNSEPERRPGKPAEAAREASRDAEPNDDAQARAIARTPKPRESRSEGEDKPARPDRRNPRSSHAGLVMMRLRTIEFPDGHREQQLLPIGRSPRVAVEAEDPW
jgi:hypothetical protein